jgi:pimeloyl-ACP methyl ester carboxylesterase
MHIAQPGPPGPANMSAWSRWLLPAAAPASSLALPAWLRTQPAMAHRLGRAACAAQGARGLEHTFFSVHAPVLILAAPRDTIVPVSIARRLAHSLPDGRFQRSRYAGHHLPRRAADAVAAAIVAFLAAADTRRTCSQAVTR